MNKCLLRIFEPTALKLKLLSVAFSASLICQCLGADGFYVAHPDADDPINLGRIDYVDSAGVVSGFYRGPGTPYALAWDGGSFLYATYGDSIKRFTLDGTVSTFATGFSGASGLAFDRSGNLFVADQDVVADQGRISKITPDGTVSLFAAGLNFPNGLAFDRAGNLYCASRLDTSLAKFSPAGVRSSFGFGLEDPQFMVFDDQGDLYVSIYGNNTPTRDTISKITPDGVVTTFATGLAAPQQMVFDSFGNLLVANREGGGINFGEGGINLITPTGDKSVFASGLFLPTGLATRPVLRIPPNIISQPANRTNAVGTTATFTITATGTRPLSYQWLKNEMNLVDVGNVSGATTARLTLANVQASDEGSFAVAVSNSLGSVTSAVAVLTVHSDMDGDGVLDDQDQCPDTALGAVVNEHGCSIEQLVACAGPRSGGRWRNHGQYVSAVAKTARVFVENGLITEEQADAIVSTAAKSTCGKK